MNCPNCSASAADGAAECGACGVIFAKWVARKPAPAAVEAPPALPQEWAAPLACSAAFAAYHAWRFSSYLPITEGWGRFETWVLPLSSLTVVIHEAGHAILGLLGWEFLTVAGGTIFQLAFPAAVIAHFVRRGERAGALFGLFWLGESLCSASLYCADAKLQALILITGMSGREGGGHDWGYMLPKLGLLSSCVGLGRLLFFLGCVCLALPVCAAVRESWRRAWA